MKCMETRTRFGNVRWRRYRDENGVTHTTWEIPSDRLSSDELPLLLADIARAEAAREQQLRRNHTIDHGAVPMGVVDIDDALTQWFKGT